ncbi:FGGY carbohydrate kinase domain-containing protein [Culicoides brevitarsis]|uniref:FGGY carbohydrate kinase domain-containing protein n=1 Tax=Culicoides brevitarsis TaxID=469753 RepID=UPI00307C6721
MSDLSYFLGIDVGTGSTRAALVAQNGQILAVSVEEIKTFTSSEGHLEQSSSNIFEGIVKNVREVLKKCPDSGKVRGIGVCATCSLVAIDKNGEPVSVSLSGRQDQNIILWMDHRAKVEADIINGKKHEILKFVGGQVSLEMEVPKLMWLKRNLRENFEKVAHFFDLPDFITWKLTGGSPERSVCSLVCKWNYDAINGKWCDDFLRDLDLGEIASDNFERLGNKVQSPGEAIKAGLSPEIAKIFGLRPGIAVASSMIDAHCGALGVLGCQLEGLPSTSSLTSKLAIIAGTSSCHMSITREPLYVDGIWGPYYNAMFPKTFLNEAGQSTSGHLLDFVIESHPAYSTLKNNFLTKVEIVRHLNALIQQMTKDGEIFHEITKNYHVYPDFHGNRSPFANPDLKGMICGLTLENDERNLAKLYLATMQALAYGTKLIIDQLYDAGREKFAAVLMCGGLSKNEIFVQTHADVLEMPIGLPETTEAVLLGGAILGACAAQLYPTLEDATNAMSGNAKTIHSNHKSFDFHRKKYKVFRKMVQDQLEYKRIMDGN